MKRNTSEQHVGTGGREPHPHIVTIRLTEAEYEDLQEKIKAGNGSLSQYIRSKIFDNSGTESRKAERNDSDKKVSIALQGMRSDFRNAVDFYEKTVSIFNENIVKNERFFTTEQAVRMVRSLVEQTLSLQRGLNLVFNICREKEEHRAAKITVKEPTLPASSSGTLTDEQFKIKYTFMQKITVFGNVAVDATTYKPKDGGAEKMKFRVIVNTVSGGAKKATSYAVFAEKTDVFPYIKKGKLVLVTGDFDQSIRRSKADGKVSLDDSGDPIIDNFIYADSVKLGGN